MSPSLVVAVLGDVGSVAVAETTAAFGPDVDAGRCRVVTVEGVSSARSALADSSFVTFICGGERPASDAIALITSVLDARPDIDLLYGDEVLDAGVLNADAVGGDPVPFHKPAWSPERLLSHNYVGSMATYRSTFVAGADVADATGLAVEQQLHDLALQAASNASVVAHLPRILCNRRATLTDDSVLVVQRHFDRQGWPAKATMTSRTWAGRRLGGFEPALGEARPLVSIVIPTGGSSRTVRGETFVLVDNAITSLIERSTYAAIEIVVVVDAKSTTALAERLRGLDERVRIVKDTRPFNFAAACNLGVQSSNGSIVVLLNDDTEVVTENWVERLIVLTSPDNVGAVGVKLFYSDGRVQHGGVATRDTGPDHLYHGYPGDDVGHGGWLQSIVNCFAATGACLAVRRDHWDAVGGMDEQFPLNYNDIDLCLRLHAEGWRTVVDNQTELMHLETSSRPAGSKTWEVDAFRERWGTWLNSDPYDNPNLVTVGLQQVPPPAVLTTLAEHRGRIQHPARIWSRSEGFGLAVNEQRVGDQ